MFVSNSTIAALEAGMEALRQRVAQLDAEVGVLRPLAADALRLETMAKQAELLSRSTEAALSSLKEQANEAGVARERFVPQPNAVYQADVAGYICVYFVSGFTDRVELVVGPSNPPAQVVCVANTSRSVNPFAGAIVRKGEFWMIRSANGRQSGFAYLFTPLV